MLMICRTSIFSKKERLVINCTNCYIYIFIQEPEFYVMKQQMVCTNLNFSQYYNKYMLEEVR